MEVMNGKNVSVHYRGTLDDGTVFDSSRERGQPITFEVGSKRMIPGFNDAVIGMTEGQTKSVTIAKADAYGDRDETAIQNVPKNAFAEDFEFKIGGVIQGNGPRGPFMAKIKDIQETDVVLDFNHPLAGHNLSFEIEVMTINETTETATNPETPTEST